MGIHAYFVSDLHLSAADEERTRLFVQFLSRLGTELPCSDLFLLGDIFDLWLGDYRYFQDRYASIISEIQRLIKLGIKVRYFEGNHDLYLKKFWGDQLGVEVHCGPLNLSLGPWRLRLEHGDQMDPHDRGYIFLRWLLRTAVMKVVANTLPEAVLVNVGKHASQSSRKYTSQLKSQDPATARAKMQTHAKQVHADEPFDLLIAGHLHVREDQSIHGPTGSYRLVNLGWWVDQPAAFVLTETEGHWLPLPQGSAVGKRGERET